MDLEPGGLVHFHLDGVILFRSPFLFGFGQGQVDGHPVFPAGDGGFHPGGEAAEITAGDGITDTGIVFHGDLGGKDAVVLGRCDGALGERFDDAQPDRALLPDEQVALDNQRPVFRIRQHRRERIGACAHRRSRKEG